MTGTSTDTPVLSGRDLSVSFPSEAGTVNAVRGVSFDLYRGRTLGIVCLLYTSPSPRDA